MIELISPRYQFDKAIKEGDYFRALGVPESARKLDIDVAAARLAEQLPDLAHRISAVANVLTARDKRAVYDALQTLRSAVTETLTQRYGSEFLEWVPDFPRRLWQECCKLMRFDLEYSSLLVGPKGAASLATVGVDWIVERIVFLAVDIVLSIQPIENFLGAAVRYLWYAECPRCERRQPVLCCSKKVVTPPSQKASPPPAEPEFEPTQYSLDWNKCTHCGATLGHPTEWDDTYRFTIPPGAESGCLLCGQGQQTGKTLFAFKDRYPPKPQFPPALQLFYQTQEKGEDVPFIEFITSLKKSLYTHVSSCAAGAEERNSASDVPASPTLAQARHRSSRKKTLLEWLTMELPFGLGHLLVLLSLFLILPLVVNTKQKGPPPVEPPIPR